MIVKTCKTCGEDKDLSEFYKRSDTGKPRHECKVCTSSRVAKRYAGSEEVRASHKVSARSYTLKKYGITKEIFDKMYESQGGKCKLCGTPIIEMGTIEEISTIACVDHCHTSGKTRGLLCRPCNTGLGQFKDRTDLLERAIQYLRESNAA